MAKTDCLDKLHALENGAVLSQEELQHMASEVRAEIQNLDNESIYQDHIRGLMDIIIVMRPLPEIPEMGREISPWCSRGERTPQIEELFSRVQKRMSAAFDKGYGLHLRLIGDTIGLDFWYYESPTESPDEDGHGPHYPLRSNRQNYSTNRTIAGLDVPTWTADDFQEFEERCIEEFISYTGHDCCAMCGTEKPDRYSWLRWSWIVDGAEGRICNPCFERDRPARAEKAREAREAMEKNR
jgi:hypothetical protein